MIFFKIYNQYISHRNLSKISNIQRKMECIWSPHNLNEKIPAKSTFLKIIYWNFFFFTYIIKVKPGKKSHPHQCKSYINRSAPTNLILTSITNLIFHWEFQHYPEKGTKSAFQNIDKEYLVFKISNIESLNDMCLFQTQTNRTRENRSSIILVFVFVLLY